MSAIVFFCSKYFCEWKVDVKVWTFALCTVHHIPYLHCHVFVPDHRACLLSTRPVVRQVADMTGKIDNLAKYVSLFLDPVSNRLVPSSDKHLRWQENIKLDKMRVSIHRACLFSTRPVVRQVADMTGKIYRLDKYFSLFLENIQLDRICVSVHGACLLSTCPVTWQVADITGKIYNETKYVSLFIKPVSYQLVPSSDTQLAWQEKYTVRQIACLYSYILSLIDLSRHQTSTWDDRKNIHLDKMRVSIHRACLFSTRPVVKQVADMTGEIFNQTKYVSLFMEPVSCRLVPSSDKWLTWQEKCTIRQNTCLCSWSLSPIDSSRHQTSSWHDRKTIQLAKYMSLILDPVSSSWHDRKNIQLEKYMSLFMEPVLCRLVPSSDK